MLIFLPRGPFLHNLAHEAAALSILRARLPYIIVKINYRLSQAKNFPTPIHDTLAGYDWIVKNLLLKQGISCPGRSDRVSHVAVCGELIGGGLATMLALTECRIGQLGIVSAAINNPIVDWPNIGLDEKAVNGINTAETLTGSAGQLARLRSQLFRRPEQFFDPFASPLLFFRAASQNIPVAAPDAPLDDLEHLAYLEREEHHRQQLDLDVAGGLHPLSPAEKPPRKVSKRYPRAALSLRLPSFYISAGVGSLFNGQSAELSQQLERSHLRQAASSSFGSKVWTDEELDQFNGDTERQALEEIKGKVRFRLYEGAGLWDDTDSGADRVHAAAQWLKAQVK